MYSEKPNSYIICHSSVEFKPSILIQIVFYSSEGKALFTPKHEKHANTRADTNIIMWGRASAVLQ